MNIIKIIIMELTDLIGKMDIGINFFGIVAGLASIISFVHAVTAIKEAKIFDYKIKVEESSRFYYEKRIKTYEIIKNMFNQYSLYVCSENYIEVIDSLNKNFDLVITDLQTLFDEEYAIKFQNLYNVVVRNLYKMILNSNKMKNSKKKMDEITRVLERKPIGYLITIDEPEKLDEIDWDVDNEIYKFEVELIKYINSKAKAFEK